MRLKWNCSLVNFITVLKYTSNKKVNDHGRAIICGYVTKEDEETLLYKNVGNTFCKIELEEEKKKTTLFAGLVESVRIEKQGDMPILSKSIARLKTAIFTASVSLSSILS